MLKQKCGIGSFVVVVAAGLSLMGAASAPTVTPSDGDEKGRVDLHPITTLFNNFNSGGVVNQPRTTTTFILASATTITGIQTYHWNAGRGKTPGTIKLTSGNGKSYGPCKHIGRPVPNAALLGAFAALTGTVRLDSVAKAIREQFPGTIGDANVAAATEAHDAVVARVKTAA